MSNTIIDQLAQTHNAPERADATLTLPKLPIEGEDKLGQSGMTLAPCGQRHCIFPGGHVVEGFDPLYVHSALIVHESGFEVEVTRGTHENSWNVWAALNCDDGQVRSAAARDFAAALEIAEDVAAALNEAAEA